MCIFRYEAAAAIAFTMMCTPASAQEDRSGSTSSADLVRALYDGDRALETVAFLDQYVRWPGNRGFDASIDHVADRLEDAGYILQSDAAEGERLTYRVEEYPMDRPAWEPLDASVEIIDQSAPVLDFSSNRNMLARRSYSTDAGGIMARVTYAGSGSAAELDEAEVSGKVVLVDAEIANVFEEAVIERGAIGVLAYSLPSYLQPAVNKHSIQFRGIPEDIAPHQAWAISLSTDAREKIGVAMDLGPVELRIKTSVKWTEPAIERTVVADISGSAHPQERFVFSAHVQEPGANDNASGVGAQVEMARIAADLFDKGQIDPQRSITFLWGLEIQSTRRYVEQDPDRAAGIRWGVSLDMVGEDTSKTGGTFLIEKMPDPSAIWTRGSDQHSEWGGDVMGIDDMQPHYLNDVVLGRALEQASTNGWIVKTNPFEGGSDHVPFLDAGIPGLLLWHFTDQFYHTDRDRLEMVSPDELTNVGVTALTTALTLTSADGRTARALVDEVLRAANDRIYTEATLSTTAIAIGADVDYELAILHAWADWYDKALASMVDIEVGGSQAPTRLAIQDARNGLQNSVSDVLGKIAEIQTTR